MKIDQISEVYDPEYEHDTDDHVVKHKDDNGKNFWAVYNHSGEIVKVFYDQDKAKSYAEKNHDALMKDEIVAEKWSKKYKRSINCNNPKGFSQKAHCQGRKKNESIMIEDGWWDAYKKIRDSGDDVAPYLKSRGWNPYSKKDVTQFIDQALSHPDNQAAAKWALDLPMWMIAGAAQKQGIDASELKNMIDVRNQYKQQNPNYVTQFRNDPVGTWQQIKNEAVNEELYDFDKEQPMKSTVAVPGYGTMSIDGLMKNLIQSVTELLGKMKQGTSGMRAADYELNKNKVLTSKLAALIQALDDLQAIRAKGGARSRNIQQEAEQQPLPVDMDRIRDKIQQFESKQYITPQEADNMRRSIQSLASGRKPIYPEAVLQLLTIVT